MQTDEERDNRYDGWGNFCSQINGFNIYNFRKNNYFRSIVETVSPHFGMLYFNNINNKYSKYISNIDWKTIEVLANVGSPYNQQYIFNNNKYSLSPTILRYIQFTLDTLTHIKNNTPLTELNIVEIGGGFGFQGILLYEFAHLFDLKVSNYTIVDLKSVCNLQNTFINECKKFTNITYNLNAITFDDYKENNNNFFISNYALGELNTYWQNTYIRNIVSKIKHGYLCWNFSPENPKIHSYFHSIKTTQEEENPQTNNSVKNYIIRY